MTRVPDSSTIIVLVPAWAMGAPFLNQLIVGLGFPDAWQGKIAIVLIGSVWLAGPIAMIGGGWSSMAVTSRYALVTLDPATLNAEQM